MDASCAPGRPPPTPHASRSRSRSHVADELIQRSHVIPRQPFALVLAPDDVAELHQILQERSVVIGPLLLAFHLGLQAPIAPEALSAHFPFPSLRSGLFPDMNVAHRCDFSGAWK